MGPGDHPEPAQQATVSASVPRTDYTFLEKGLQSSEERAYLEALQYFQRYQRIEKSELATVESGIAIAYLSILPDSPYWTARPPVTVTGTATRSRIRPELHAEVQLMRRHWRSSWTCTPRWIASSRPTAACALSWRSAKKRSSDCVI